MDSNISLRISAKIKEQLKKYAAENGMQESAFVRFIIVEHLTKLENKKQNESKVNEA